MKWNEGKNEKPLFGRFRTILFFTLLLHLTVALAQKPLPKPLVEAFATALEHYPELANARIQLKLKNGLKKATMQARPTFGSLFRRRELRQYTIFVSRHFAMGGRAWPVAEAPEEVLVGWLGHELGHILDYEQHGNWSMLGYGLSYLFSKKHIVSTEKKADRWAVLHGMGHYLKETKNYIQSIPNLSDAYRKRLEKYYLTAQELDSLATEATDAHKCDGVSAP
ncbi:hypothetical protein [Maribacter sp. 2307ULW6-5]|uniref:hypothetical protein n=1 Tax=Maribacter sp. 2307ULW6-5 TaxID=3386275 RepID=UPI0039BCF689